MKQVLRFAINTPTEVALEAEAGKHVEGRYGEQVQYSLVGDRVMYVPPLVEQRIQELALGANEPFEIVKKEIANGTRKFIEWHVRRIPNPSESVANAAADAQFGGGHKNGANGSGAHPPNGNGDGANPHPPAPLPDVVTGPGIRAMDLALNGAAEIAQRVEVQAAQKGFALRFTSEDIRAIGLTLFIQATREASPRWQQ